MDVALGEEEVMGGGGVDVRGALRITNHLDRRTQTGHVDLPIDLGKRAAHQEEAKDRSGEDEGQQNDQDAADPTHDGGAYWSNRLSAPIALPFPGMQRLLLAIMIAVLVIACGDTPTTTTTVASGPSTTNADEVDVNVAGGVIDGPDHFEYHLGDQVEIVVLTDVADEIHVHGYDKMFDAEPGVPVVISFEADVQGIFEVELEGSALKLFEIQVTP